MSHPQMPSYSSMLSSVFVNGAPRALKPLVVTSPHGILAKTESNQSKEREAIFLEVLHSCLMSKYRWEGRCLRLKTSTFKLCHIICQLNSVLDNVDGVKQSSRLKSSTPFKRDLALQNIPFSEQPLTM